MSSPRPVASLLMTALLLGTAAALGQQAVPQSSPEAIWRSSCSYCHEGGVAQPLLGMHPPVETILQIVRTGIGAMPPFHPSEITQAQLKELARWLHEHPAPPDAHGKSQ